MPVPFYESLLQQEKDWLLLCFVQLLGFLLTFVSSSRQMLLQHQGNKLF